MSFRRFIRCMACVLPCAAMSLIPGESTASADAYDSAYHSYSDTAARLVSYVARDPGLVHLRSIGHSVQGRPLPALTIGDASGPAARLLITCGQHGREWISIAVCMGVADRFIDGYSSDPALRRLIDKHPIDIVPIVNPDGYEYTRTDDRMWRKNRADARGPLPWCSGVDLNRNYDYRWDGAGASDDQCDENYAGPAAFSEPETRAVREFVEPRKYAAAIDFHSHHQTVTYSDGPQPPSAPSRRRLAEAADRVGDAMSEPYGTHWETGTTREVLYRAEGDMTSWLYGVHGILALTVELRDTGKYGFELPPEQIRPSIEEACHGTAALLADL